MAVTLVLEDGTGLDADANSYIDADEAAEFIEPNIHAWPAWSALSANNKDALLIYSTMILDARTTWEGRKTVVTSPLRWPRTGVIDRDCICIDANVIPAQLKRATAEMARYLVSSDRTVERSQDGLSRIKVDVIEVEFLKGYQLPVIPEDIMYMLQGIGRIARGSVNFVKILKS